MTKYMLTTLAAILGAASISHAREIVDDQYGFRITIPDAFRDSPETKKGPSVLYSFISSPSDKPEEVTVIVIESLPGPISRESLTPAEMEAKVEKSPHAGRVQAFKAKWKGYDVIGLEDRQSVGGVELTLRAVDIPLRRRAIRVAVLGTPQTKAKITRVLDQLVGTLEGESNWDDGRQEDALTKRVEATTRLLLYVSVVIGIVLLVRHLKKSRKAAAQTQTYHQPHQQPIIVEPTIVEPTIVEPTIVEPISEIIEPEHDSTNN